MSLRFTEFVVPCCLTRSSLQIITVFRFRENVLFYSQKGRCNNITYRIWLTCVFIYGHKYMNHPLVRFATRLINPWAGQHIQFSRCRSFLNQVYYNGWENEEYNLCSRSKTSTADVLHLQRSSHFLSLVKGTLAKRLAGKTTGHSCYSYSKEIRQHFLIKMSALVFTSIKHVSMTFFESLLICNENTQLKRTLNAMTHWCLLPRRLATTAN